MTSQTLTSTPAKVCDSLPEEGISFLRVDASVNCNGAEYLYFRKIILASICLYQLIPLYFLKMLFGQRAGLNPVSKDGWRRAEDEAVKIEKRNIQGCDCLLRFLWTDYKPAFYLFEVADLYRRIFFVALLPLLGTGLLRVVVGCFAAFIWVKFVREAQPFIDGSTNLLLHIAAYQILVTFLSALVISSGALAIFHLSDLVLGLILIAANSGMLAFTSFWCLLSYRREQAEAAHRYAVSSAQMKILEGVLRLPETASTETTSKQRDVQELLQKHLVEPKEVRIGPKIGSGSFGEVRMDPGFRLFCIICLISIYVPRSSRVHVRGSRLQSKL